jgi:hypothetical protein
MVSVTTIFCLPLGSGLLDVISSSTGKGGRELNPYSKPKVCRNPIFYPQQESPRILPGQSVTHKEVCFLRWMGNKAMLVYSGVLGIAMFDELSSGSYEVRLTYENQDDPGRYWVGRAESPWIPVVVK